MIVGITNIAGSGKTLFLTRQAKTYDVIFANYKLNEQYFKGKKIYYVKDIEDFFKYDYISFIKKIKSERPSLQVILAVDEAGLFFPSIQFKKMNSSFLYLFNQHRKLGIDLYYTVQNLSLVHRALRVNTMYTYYIGHIWHLFYFSAWDRYFVGKKGCKLWGGMFLATDVDYKSYNTYEMLAGADWYIESVKEVAQSTGKKIILTNS
ncbi:MAG: zonular occludens toxin domain-containing protein [Thermoproteota archaeon]